MTTITIMLSWMFFKNDITLDSSDRLIRNLFKTCKEEEIEARIKDLRDVYVKGHNNEGTPDEDVLLKMLTDLFGH